jgi:tetratricopeptide (TPR) repeat protein
MEFSRLERTKLGRLLLDASAAGARSRRRAAAASGIGLFLFGLMIAVGLGMLVVALLLATGTGAVLTAAVTRIRRRSLRTSAASVAGIGRRGLRTATVRVTRVGRHGLRTASFAVVAASAACRRAVAGRGSAIELVREHAAALRPAVRIPSARSATDARREAVRLNAEGTQLRRDGNRREALARHRTAVELFRELGDRQGEALTLNNLALALARDDDAQAMRHFEESLEILRELGDRQHEGKVLANLAFAHRRQGHGDEAIEQLEEALTKLEPWSPERERVERQLRQAS